MTFSRGHNGHSVARALNVWSSDVTCTILRDSEKVFVTRVTFRELICIVLFVWPVLLSVCYARRTLVMSCYTVEQRTRPMLQRMCFPNKTARLSVAHLSIDDNMDVQYQVYHSYKDCSGDSLYLGLSHFTSANKHTYVRTDDFREFKHHVYGKQQTSASSGEFLKTENEQIKTAQNNSYG